jgi:antitoxin MazE
MKLQISKWGNSLAVRLPAAFIRNMGAKAGDSVEAEIDSLGKITLTPAQTFDMSAFVDKMRKQQAEMPMSYLTVAEIRKLERY